VVLAFLIATPTLWGLVHEGIHGRLFRRPVANRTAARALCVLLGFSSEPQRIKRVRLDCAAGAAIMLIGFLHYASYWPVLLLALYGRRCTTSAPIYRGRRCRPRHTPWLPTAATSWPRCASFCVPARTAASRR
jgi:hypothetical protein